MATKLLLVKDVESLGRSGEVVTVKPGYARNYLLPQGWAIIANKQTLRQQERLKQERQKQAAEDKREAEAIAAQLEGVNLTVVVKVDHEGHMYGSVTALEIAHLLHEQKNLVVEKKAIQLKHPIKTTGVHSVTVRLKEGVAAAFNVTVLSEEAFKKQKEAESSSAS